MHAPVVGKFRMEGGSHGASLPYRYRIRAFGSHDGHAFAYVLNLRRAYKHHLQRGIMPIGIDEFTFTDGAVNLSTVSVSPDANVDSSQSSLPRILHFSG